MNLKDLMPEEYINELPEERKAIISKVRETILKNLPKGFQEGMGYGMIGYVVPHSLYPKGYHCNPKLPLPFLSLSSQKNYISLYHMGLYEGELLEWYKNEWKKVSSKKVDIGKCCIRFKKPEDVPLELIGELVSKVTPQQWIEYYEANVKSR